MQNIQFKYFFLIFAAIISKNFYSQQHYQYYDKFTVQDGLPNNFISSLHHDSKGYLWVGTLNGLAKFDGNSFSSIQDKEGTAFNGHVVYDIEEDYLGNIWVSSIGLSKFDRKTGTWENFSFSSDSLNKDKNEFIYYIAKESDSIFWLTSIRGLFRYNIDSNKYQHYSFSNQFQTQKTRLLKIEQGEYIIGRTRDYYFKFDIPSKKFEEIDIDNEFTLKQVSFNNTYILNKNSNNEIYSCNSFTREKKKLTNKEGIRNGFFTIGDKLFHVQSTEIEIFNKDFERIDSVYIDNIDKNNEAVFDHYSFTTTDKGVYWVGNANGLFRVINDKTFQNLNLNNGLKKEYVRSIYINRNNELIYSSKKLGPFLIEDVDSIVNSANNKFSCILLDSSQRTVNKIFDINDQKSLFLSTSRILLYNSNKPKSKILNTHISNFWSILKQDSAYWIGALGEIPLMKVLMEDDKLVVDTSFVRVNNSLRVFEIFEDSQNQIWIGGEGLYKLNHNEEMNTYSFEEWLPYYDSVSNKACPVWNILELNKNFLLVGTTENGCVLINKFTKESYHFGVASGLSSHVISSIVKDNNNNLWIATIDGLNYYNVNKQKLVKFYTQDGLISNDFNFKSYDKTKDGWLFFGTKKGIVYFHPDSIITEREEYPLLINHCKVLDKVVASELENNDTLVLEHDQNYFSLEFAYLDLSYRSKYHYEYKLLGYDNNFNITESNHPIASYTKIPPGHYKFTLNVIDNINKSLLNSIEINVQVKPSFYQTAFFKLLILSITILTVSTIIYQLFRRQRYKSKVSQLQLSLIRSQMNPHFIFNTLTSIQNFILKKERMMAFDYLSKFSRLMRNSLDYSTREYVPVRDAIKFLENYVNLESLKFKQGVEFQLIVDEVLKERNISISPMIIQPFLENALVHGLSPKRIGCKLKLELKMENKFVSCIVEDNGIGRTKSAEIKKNNAQVHKSMGMEITKKRIMLQLKKDQIKEGNIKVIDKFDNLGKPCGTKVSFKMAYV